jgi:hypothetical protein
MVGHVSCILKQNGQDSSSIFQTTIKHLCKNTHHLKEIELGLHVAFDLEFGNFSHALVLGLCFSPNNMRTRFATIYS